MDGTVYANVKSIELGDEPPESVSDAIDERAEELRGDQDVDAEMADLIARYEYRRIATEQQQNLWSDIIKDYVLGGAGVEGLTIGNILRCIAFWIRYRVHPSGLASEEINRLKRAKDYIPFDEWAELDEDEQEAVREASAA